MWVVVLIHLIRWAVSNDHHKRDSLSLYPGSVVPVKLPDHEREAKQHIYRCKALQATASHCQADEST